MNTLMRELVPQSETKKYIAGIFLDQKLAEAYKIYNAMKQIRSQIREKQIVARKKFDQRISPFQVRLNQARMESGMYTGQNRIPDENDCRPIDIEVRIKSCKHFYHMIAKKLHCKGDFISGELMDRASKAFKKGRFHALFDIWENIKGVTINEAESTGTKTDEDDQFLHKIRYLHFLQLSIDVIEQRIIQLEEDIIYKSYTEGRDVFEQLLDDTEKAIKEEIEIIEQRLNHE